MSGAKKTKWPYIIVLLALGLGLSFYAFWQIKWRETLSAPTSILKSMPEFELIALKDGALIDRSTFFNRSSNSSGIFWHLWATWCAPCLREIPEIIAFAQKNPNLTFSLVAIRDEKEDIERFLASYANRWPSNIVFFREEKGIEERSPHMQSLGVRQLPETFIFSPAGKALWKFSGAQEWGLPYYQQKLDRLL